MLFSRGGSKSALQTLVAGFVMVTSVAWGGSISPLGPLGPRPAVAQDGWSAELEQTSSRPLPPAGYGTLSQDQITIGITAGTLLIKLVPLDEWVIRLTAPDTYQRLNSYKVSRGEEILRRARRSGERGWPQVFLVSFFTRSYEESFEPNDLQIRNQSFIYRPLNIIPITPEFNRERLRQQDTQMALYLFTEEIDLDLPLVALYENSEGPQWVGIRSTLDRELATVLSRAAPQSNP